MKENLEQLEARLLREAICERHRDAACTSIEKLFELGEMKRLANLRKWMDFRLAALEAKQTEREKSNAKV